MQFISVFAQFSQKNVQGRGKNLGKVRKPETHLYFYLA